MNEPILPTKLQMPFLRQKTVCRPQLVQLLRTGLGQGRPLTLICAPAGYGKTTLARQALAEAESPVAWLSLDRGDSEPGRFARYLLAALRSADPAFGEAARCLSDTSQPPPVDLLADELIAAQAHGAGRAICVLDDYHLLDHSFPHRLLQRLLDHPLPALHLVLLTREEPPLALSRLRAGNLLTELRAEQLRFSEQEAASFLRECMGLTLEQRLIDALAARTEGWIAGLQLAAVCLASSNSPATSTRSQPDPENFIGQFAGANRYVLDYLMEEVLACQSPALRRFLLQTSVLQRFCAPLCEEVVALPGGTAEDGLPEMPAGQLNARAALDALERGNLFLVPLDDQRTWYRYHHLFADLLGRQLQTHATAEAQANLHSRASRWYARQGLGQDAIHHALAAGDWAAAGQLIHQETPECIKRSEIQTLLAWCRALPSGVLQADPGLCGDYGWALAIAGRLDQAEIYLRLAEAGQQDSPPILGDTLAGLAYVARAQGDTARALALGERALTLLAPEDLWLRSTVMLVAGLARWQLRQLPACEAAMHQAVQMAQRAGGTRVYGVARVFLARLRVLALDLHGAERAYQAILSEPELGPHAPGADWAHLDLAALYYEWNDLEQASAHVARALALSQESSSPEVRLAGQRTLARIRQANGDARGALAALEQAHALVDELLLAHPAQDLTAACHVQIALAQSDPAAAAYWAGQIVEDTSIDAFHPLPGLAHVQLLIQQGHQTAARARLQTLHPLVEAPGWELARLRHLLLAALAALDAADATRFLRAAIALGKPAGAVRSFFDLAPGLAALLPSLSLPPDHQVWLKDLFTPFIPSKPGITSADATLIEPLRERELEILRLLVEEPGYNEIARQLVLSPNTVKTHVRHLYEKLQAQNRRQALAAARRLGLLG